MDFVITIHFSNLKGTLAHSFVENVALEKISLAKELYIFLTSHLVMSLFVSIHRCVQSHEVLKTPNTFYFKMCSGYAFREALFAYAEARKDIYVLFYNPPPYFFFEADYFTEPEARLSISKLQLFSCLHSQTVQGGVRGVMCVVTPGFLYGSLALELRH